MFLKKVQKTIDKYHMLQKGDFVVVGLSGGADSMALLTVLYQLQEQYEMTVEAVHIHHGLRGAEADRDAAFAEQYCKTLHIPYHYFFYDVAKEAKQAGIGLEEMGRKLRYAALEQIAGEQGKIAVAHHQNDQAETVLLHLCRGAGMTGLVGIAPVQGNRIRPFLQVQRAEIEAYLQEQNIAYCEDSTNGQEVYQRNKIRLSVLPFLQKEINTKTIEHMALSAELLREENEFLESMAKEVFQSAVLSITKGTVVLQKEKLLTCPSVLRRRVLRRAFRCLGKGLQDLSYIHIQQAESLLTKETGKRLSLPLGRQISIEYQRVVLSLDKIHKETGYFYKLLPEKAIYIKEIDKFVLLSFNAHKKVEKAILICTKVLNYDKIKKNIICRTRKQGDIISIGGGHRKKLKDFFIDAKIPRQERDTLLLIAAEHEILWIPEYRVGEGILADEKTQNKVWVSVWRRSDV